MERLAAFEISLAASVNESSPSETNVVAWLMPFTRTAALDAKLAPITRTFTGCVPTSTLAGSSDVICGSFGSTDSVTAVDAVEPGFVVVIGSDAGLARTANGMTTVMFVDHTNRVESDDPFTR